MDDLQAANDALLAAFQKAICEIYKEAAASPTSQERSAYERAVEILGDTFEDALVALRDKENKDGD